jgi:hypothetical protein
MIFYGAIEIAHDLLHYLADHHHSSLHGHYHDQHHGEVDENFEFHLLRFLLAIVQFLLKSFRLCAPMERSLKLE